MTIKTKSAKIRKAVPIIGNDLKTLIQVESAMLDGITSVPALMIRFGMTAPRIKKMMVKVRRLWETQTDLDIERRRSLRLRQLENVLRKANNAFEASKILKPIITTENVYCEACVEGYHKCRVCNGEGRDEYLPRKFKICQRCNGEKRVQCRLCDGGIYEKEVITRIEGPGDPSFLKLAAATIVDIAKHEGSGPTTGTATLRSIQTSDDTTERLTQEIEVTVDDPAMLLRAMGVINELKNGKAPTQTIETTKEFDKSEM